MSVVLTDWTSIEDVAVANVRSFIGSGLEAREVTQTPLRTTSATDHRATGCEQEGPAMRDAN